MGHGTRCHRVVAINTMRFISHDKGATGSADLIDHCPTLEPFIQHRLAAGKIGAMMI
jgi:hypothetical protein